MTHTGRDWADKRGYRRGRWLRAVGRWIAENEILIELWGGIALFLSAYALLIVTLARALP